MIATAIILGILALFVLIFSARVKVTVEMNDELFLTVSFLGIRIKILPKRKKKYKLRNYTKKKIAKRDRQAAIKAQLDAERKAKKQAEKRRRDRERELAEQKLTKEERRAQRKAKRESRPPLPDMLSLFTRIVGVLFSGLFKKFHFHIERLRIKIGGADAAQIALTYTVLTNALHPLFAFLDKASNLHGVKRADICISTDYLSEDIEADVKLGFSTSLGGILGALIKTGFKFIRGWMKISPKHASYEPPKLKPEDKHELMSQNNAQTEGETAADGDTSSESDPISEGGSGSKDGLNSSSSSAEGFSADTDALTGSTDQSNIKQ